MVHEVGMFKNLDKREYVLRQLELTKNVLPTLIQGWATGKQNQSIRDYEYVQNYKYVQKKRETWITGFTKKIRTMVYPAVIQEK